jgi:hypothetical protein
MYEQHTYWEVLLSLAKTLLIGVAGIGSNFPTTARGQLKNRKKKDSRKQDGNELCSHLFVPAN